MFVSLVILSMNQCTQAGWSDYVPKFLSLDNFKKVSVEKYGLYAKPAVEKGCQKLSEVTPAQWGFFGIGFVGITAYCAKKKIDRERIAKDFDTIVDQMTIEEENFIKDIKTKSNSELFKQLSSDDISEEYFSKEKPRVFVNSNFFHTSEARSIMEQLDERKNAMKNEKDETEEISERKPRPAIDVRELSELGKLANSSNNRYFISFKGLVNESGNSVIRASSVERVPGFKTIANRQTNAIEQVPHMRKQIGTLIVGTENENGEFLWQKIKNNPELHENSASENVKKANKKGKNISFAADFADDKVD